MYFPFSAKSLSTFDLLLPLAGFPVIEPSSNISFRRSSCPRTCPSQICFWHQFQIWFHLLSAVRPYLLNNYWVLSVTMRLGFCWCSIYQLKVHLLGLSTPHELWKLIPLNRINVARNVTKSSEVAVMGDHGHNRHWPKRGAAVPRVPFFWGGSWVPI